jgi:putative MATE family efflux protein
MPRFKNVDFYKTLFKFALPIALQNLIASSLNILDTIMVGRLGETAIAGVGVAGQIFFLLNLLLFGTYSGACIYAAQYWGKGDIDGVRKVIGTSIKVGCSIALIFTLVNLLFPYQVMALFTKDPEVVELGVQFLMFNTFTYIISAVTFCYALITRSTGITILPLMASFVALSVNTILNFLLISGRFGFPAMGVKGAGLSTLISRLIELAIVLSTVYLLKYPTAAGWKELCSFDLTFFRRYAGKTGPVIVHEGMWAIGMTIYTAIYAHMGTDVVAAMNIAGNIERLSMVLFFGIGNACAIIIGHRIGENKPEQAEKDAGRLLTLGPALGVTAGILLLASYRYLFPFYNVSEGVRHSAGLVLTVISFVMPFRIFNLIMIVGVSRAGGDTIFGMLMELLPLWLVAIPLAVLGGLVLKLPLFYVYLLMLTEEFIKFAFGLFRYLSRKWIHNVVQL